MVWEPTAQGLPPAFLPSCLLLLLAEDDAHGYQLWMQITELGIEVDSGTVYRRLRAMEGESLVESDWELSDSGPPRRTYSLTATGRDRLEVSQDRIEVVAGLLEVFEVRCRQVMGPGQSCRSRDEVQA